MDLTELKAKKQREVLRTLGERLIEASKNEDDDSVEAHLQTLQEGYLDVLGPEDFFGTEGWEHWLGLD